MPTKVRSGAIKHYVLDTNVLLHDPTSLLQFDEHSLYLPFVTLEELDKHKTGTDDLNRNARQAIRQLETLLSQSDNLADGYDLAPLVGRKNTGKLYILAEPAAEAMARFDHLPDNRILASLVELRNRYAEAPVILVSKDINLRVKARSLGFKAEDYLTDHAIEDVDLLPRGYRTLPDNFLSKNLLTASDSAWQEKGLACYRVRQPRRHRFVPNEMAVLDGKLYMAQPESAAVVKFKQIIDHRHDKHSVWGITSRNEEQSFALSLLLDDNIDFVTLLGPAGTGKTLLTLAAALEMTVERKKFSEILFTRATVPMGEEIGFLPGTEEEKMMPWLGALEDNLDVLLKDTHAETAWGKNVTRDLVRERIKVKSISFMRGRTFHDKFVIVDEAQNLTPKQMKALITRIGPGSKLICMGNIAQIDTPYLSESSSGLTYAVERFKGWPHYGHLILEKGERSRLANYANENL